MAKRKQKRGLLAKIGLTGLTSFGETSMNPILGTLIGGGTAQITSMVLGNAKGGTLAANREIYGLLAGLASAGALYAMPRHRSAALPAVAGAFIGAGLAFLEKMFLGTVQVPAVTAAAAVQAANAGAVAGLGRVQIRNLSGLGMAQMRTLGAAAVSNVRPAISTVPTAGMNGPQFAGSRLGSTNPPVSLLGPATSQSNQVALLGGPQIHGLSAQYGATLLGGGR